MPSGIPIIHIHYALKGLKQPFGSALIPSGRSVYNCVSRLILQKTLGEKVVGDSFKFGYAPLAQRALYLVYEFAAPHLVVAVQPSCISIGHEVSGVNGYDKCESHCCLSIGHEVSGVNGYGKCDSHCCHTCG